MILEVVLSIALILAFLVYRSCWLVPKQNIKFYERQLQKTNYRYKIIPYSPLAHGRENMLEGVKVGDPMKTEK